MRKSNNLYTTTLNGSINPTDNLTGSFSIDRNLQQFFLKSVSWGYNAFDNLTGEVIQPVNNNMLVVFFVLGFGAITLPASPFQNIVNPVGFTNPNDGTITLNNPGQYLFENFISRTTMPVSWGVLNNDVVNSYSLVINFFAEVEPY